jgi:DNA-binding transcriptional MerR regulator
MASGNKLWRIGELADAAGLTVRTLHHYDQIGLLCPTLRNGGGQRLYTEIDARRLYKIVALRGLGLQLGQIRDCLNNELDPRPLIAEQVRALTAQIEAETHLRARLVALLGLLEGHSEPAAGDLLELIQPAAKAEQLVTSYLSAEQIARLTRHHEQLGDRATSLVHDELPRLYQRALAEYRAGTDASDAVVYAIAEQIDQTSVALSGADSASTAGVRRMWAERGEEIYPGAGIPWAELVEYLDRARSFRKEIPT